MNPYDPNTQPGPHLVAETLGVSEVSTINTTHRTGGPLYEAATRVIGAAYELDERHGQVTDAAKNALRLLEPIGDGKLSGARVSYAILRSSVPKLGDLLTQQDRAHDQLFDAISAYRRLLPEPSTERSTVKSHAADREQDSGRDDDWAIAGDRQLRALEAVNAGSLRFHQSPVYGYVYLSDSRGPHPTPKVWPETVQRLVADGLLHQDTSESLYRPGQLLSLTPQGETALREARTATPRVNAALGHSNIPANPGPGVDSATVPVTGMPETAPRSRWTTEGADPLRVLEAVEAGDVRYHKPGIAGFPYFTDSRNQRHSPEIMSQTVYQLVGEELIHQDPRTGMYWPSGQLLSLTPQGEAALREARTARAALSRSNAPAPPGPVTGPATAPATGASHTASRSR
ncbi:hypothetical protein ACFQ7A_21845 [Streptomyces sp. NPDC056528]|uniref:hypothetical protein n=1 Tax=Streptomyces sp. NPDC056528 TaxID=3345854 RepID=UPI00369F5EE5